jgi:CheY-like chemotaxis protein
MTVLNLDATKAFLNGLNRWSLSDRDFGGLDIGWTNDAGEQLAGGWFGWSNDGKEIANVGADQSSSVYPKVEFNFDGDDAYALRYCGKSSCHTENSAPLPPLPEDDEHADIDEATSESPTSGPASADTTEAPATSSPVCGAAASQRGVTSVTDGQVARDYLVILIVDDDKLLTSTFAYWSPATFDGDHVVLQATTIQDAVPLLEAAPEADVILVDGFIPHLPTDGLQVMANLRAAGYTGPMVAISSDDGIRAQMLRAGCAAACSKRKPRKLEQVIRDLVQTA